MNKINKSSIEKEYNNLEHIREREGKRERYKEGEESIKLKDKEC